MKTKKILLSFVGSNDAGKMTGNLDGAILSALTVDNFDKVILLWNDTMHKGISYKEIKGYLEKEIIRRKLVESVETVKIKLKDVTEHNQIYEKLIQFTNTLPKSKDNFYTASISSGTPAMQVCWILLAESGDFSVDNPLCLIKVQDPHYGPPANISVKLNTSLPKIIRLKEEVENLKKDLIPRAVLNTSKGNLNIGDIKIVLAPVEFCYYRYYAERAINGLDPERVSGFDRPVSFIKKIYSFHEESFPFLDTFREELRQKIRKNESLYIQTFRGNISKTNKKIKKSLNNETLYKIFSISVEGGKGAKHYGINISKDKIRII